jgi:hypothetical protein
VESLADLLALPLVVWPARELVERALQLALSLDVSMYDAAYLALADALDIPLVTADQALARKVGERGYGARIRLLGDFADAQADASRASQTSRPRTGLSGDNLTGEPPAPDGPERNL